MADPSDSNLVEVRRLCSLNFTPSAGIRATIKSQKEMADYDGDITRM